MRNVIDFHINWDLFCRQRKTATRATESG